MPAVTGTELASLLEVDRHTVTNWIRSTPPCPSVGVGSARRFIVKQVVDWLVQRRTRELEAQLEAVSSGAVPEDEVKLARQRQAIAESRLLQLELAEKEGRVVAAEDVDRVVGELADRLRPILINLPSNYILHLERLGIAPELGQPVLEAIAADLTAALRSAADELEQLHDDADAGDAPAAD